MTRLLLGLIRLYQLTFSPLLGPSCRFEPSCSRYASACIASHGPLRGSWLALCRLARCHPFHAGGYDPPPPRRASATEDVNATTFWIVDRGHAAERRPPRGVERQAACARIANRSEIATDSSCRALSAPARGSALAAGQPRSESSCNTECRAHGRSY